MATVVSKEKKEEVKAEVSKELKEIMDKEGIDINNYIIGDYFAIYYGNLVDYKLIRDRFLKENLVNIVKSKTNIEAEGEKIGIFFNLGGISKRRKQIITVEDKTYTQDSLISSLRIKDETIGAKKDTDRKKKCNNCKITSNICRWNKKFFKSKSKIYKVDRLGWFRFLNFILLYKFKENWSRNYI